MTKIKMGVNTFEITESFDAEPLLISVYDVVGNRICVSHSDGQKVFERLKKAIKTERKIILSFEEIKTSLMTPAFLNAAIGQLFREFDVELIDSIMTLKDIHDEEAKNLILRVVNNSINLP